MRDAMMVYDTLHNRKKDLKDLSIRRIELFTNVSMASLGNWDYDPFNMITED